MEMSVEAIVIYRSAETGAAVLWCGDQGPLAILPAGMNGYGQSPQIGDLLRIEIEDEGMVRHCLSWVLLRRAALPEAGDVLREGARQAQCCSENNAAQLFTTFEPYA